MRMSEERVYSPEEAPSNVRLGLLTSICIEEPILANYNDVFSLPEKVASRSTTRSSISSSVSRAG